MNLEPPPPPPPPAQPQPPLPLHNRPTTTCQRHPDQSFTGFCASCLRERLVSLEQQSTANNTSASGRFKTSTAATALKSIFRPPITGDNNNNNSSNKNKAASSSSSFLPELRRSKSFSGGKGEGFSGVFEPQRKSCDVRVRSTLWSLFNQDDVRKSEGKQVIGGRIEVETKSSGISGVGVGGPVLESKEEEEEEEEEVIEEEIRVPNVSVGVEEIEEIVEEVVEEIEPEVIQEEEEEEITSEIEAEAREEEIKEVEEEEEEQGKVVVVEEAKVVQEEEEEEEEEEEIKKMKDHIDQETQNKKAPGRDLKEIAGSFLFAASAFSKKLQNWRRKHKSKKHGGRDTSSTTMQADKPYSEIADYGFCRRSCDTDPRFSLDAARMSFDDPRYSWDEPRASWDGYLIGRTFPRLAPMVSVVEDAPIPVQRSDNQIPVEEPPMNPINENDKTPGGSAQTRDYYDSQRRRKSFERSNSMRKKTGSLVPEVDETKLASNATKVESPTSNDQILHGPKLVVTDRDWRDSNSNSMREDYSGSFESGFKDSGSVCDGIERKGSKKSRRWSKRWNIWALIYRRGGGSKDEEEEERYHRGNVVERSLSESWQELRRESNGDSKGPFNRVFRSNSSVSARNSFSMSGSLSSIKGCGEANGNGKKRRDEFVLERNRSARYSPTNDNGLLRFYLTPTNRRNGSGKSRPKNSHSITNSVLRLY